MSNIKLRSFVKVSMLPPMNVSADPVYNFFTPDERTSEESALRFQGNYRSLIKDPKTGQNKVYFQDSNGNVVSENNVKGEIPRYIQINFMPPPVISSLAGEKIDFTKVKNEELLHTSEDVQSPHDISQRFTDLSLKQRLIRKLDVASQIESEGQVSIFTTEGLNQGSINKNVQQSLGKKGNYNWELSPRLKDIVNDIIDLNASANVNTVKTKTTATKNVDEAQTMSLYTTLNKKFAEDVYMSAVDKTRLMSEVAVDHIRQQDFSNTLKDKEIKDLEVNIKASQKVQSSQSIERSKIESVGYLIERYETGETIIGSEPESTFFVNNPESTSFIDVKVKYDRIYTYTMRTVYKVTYVVNEIGQCRKLTTFLTSESTDPVQTKVEETTAPNPPDGVMYHFNYREKRGLRVSWQYPVGIQRDTKYFQIFRRKDITEPFTCIGMIDFDNSTIRTSPREYVRKDKTLKYESAFTFFEDENFMKDSAFIYAIVAIDAHGYSSGYSVQTKVTFRKTENKLILRRVSKQGAPKQYPNFFVDPDEDPNTFVNTLTQDCIKSSGYDRLRIYFDPDGMKYQKFANDASQEKQIFHTNTATGVDGQHDPSSSRYKLSLINTDRQKSQNLEILIEDARGTGYFTL